MEEKAKPVGSRERGRVDRQSFRGTGGMNEDGSTSSEWGTRAKYSYGDALLATLTVKPCGHQRAILSEVALRITPLWR